MHQACTVQGARQLAAGLEDPCPGVIGKLWPLRQQAFEVAPLVQRTGHQDGPVLAVLLALAIEHSLQGRDVQFVVTADVTELAGEGRFAKRPVQAAGQVIALALEVIAFALKLQAIDAAPAAAAGVGFVHGVELQRPQRFEIVRHGV